HQYSHSLFYQMQKQQKITRYYEAIVQGVIEKDMYTIDKRIRRKTSSIIEREVATDGKEAITHFHVLQRFEHYTYVSIRLETGRTHQIRVHFSDFGHPLLGDDLYGGATNHLNRQALNCARLEFNHPITQKLLTFHAGIPSEWNDLLFT